MPLHLIRWWATLVWALCWVPLAQATHPPESAEDVPLTVGVLSSRVPQTLEARWAPFMAYLSQQLGGRPVVLRSLDHEGLRRAAVARQVDVVLTNPGYALELRHQIGTVTYLATLVTAYQGQAVRGLGGVLVAAAGRPPLQDWNDLQGLRIGTGGAHLFDAHQVHAHEMQQRNLPYPGSNELVTFPRQEDALLAAVRGEVDVAQVRTGLLEQMVSEGQVPVGAYQVMLPQAFEGYPYHVSTRLYPEWPVMALPHLDSDLQRQVAAALLALPAHHPAAEAAGLAGVAPPADYASVERLAQALGIPPYDVPPHIDLWQVWQEYRSFIIALAGAAVFLVWSSVLLWFRHRQLIDLLRERQGLLAQIETDAERQGHLLAGSPSVIYALDPESWMPVYVGPNVGELFGVDAPTLLGDAQWWRATVHPQDLATALERMVTWRDQNYPGPLVHTYRMRHRQGHWVWVEDRLRARRDAEGQVIELIGSHTDCGERMDQEQRLRLNASVFEHAREGIVICDVQANIVDVNPSFTRITGYTREQVLGRNPRLLQSGRQDAAFYREMWRSLVQHGAWEGELLNRKATGESYSQYSTLSAVRNAAGKLTHYVAVFADITEKKAYESRLFQLAYFDELTGLPTRGLMTDRLRQALGQLRRSHGALSVAFLDLDGFKDVNDGQGHAAGDRLLAEVARRLQACVREGDTVARFGGDEFVVLLLNHNTQPAHDPQMHRLLHAAADPLTIDGVQVQVSASIGVCVCYPEGDADADQIIRQADHAMYAAKLAGKNRYEVFDSRIDDRTRSHQHLRERIMQGLLDGEFVLFYQPKVSMRTGQLQGVEALIRWRHPEQGLLAPGAFLPATEGHPVELALGRWVLAEAACQVERWLAEGWPVPVSVNISADHLLAPAFVDELADLLRRHPGLPPQSLELEVLESTALEDVERASEVLMRCASLGVRAALDDFGTGYSSLTYLKTLPTHTLKIDQSFVRDMINDPDDLAILQGVLDLARVFRRQVVAEGVETETHGLMLLHLGCELGQGYGIARPMPAAEVLPWAQRWRPSDRWQQVPPHQADQIELLMGAVHLRQCLQQLRGQLEAGADGTLDLAGCAEEAPWLAPVPELWGNGPEVQTLHQDLVDRVRACVAQGQAGDRSGALAHLGTAEAVYERLLAQLLKRPAEA